jgi:hypothetical protein
MAVVANGFFWAQAGVPFARQNMSARTKPAEIFMARFSHRFRADEIQKFFPHPR